MIAPFYFGVYHKKTEDSLKAVLKYNKKEAIAVSSELFNSVAGSLIGSVIWTIIVRITRAVKRLVESHFNK